jgi:hypothetical protein
MAADARGVAYAAKAARLAAADDPAAAADEVRWQLRHATPAVREILRRLPPAPRRRHPRPAHRRPAQVARSRRMTT